MPDLKAIKVFVILGKDSEHPVKGFRARYPYVTDEERKVAFFRAAERADAIKWDYDIEFPGNNVSVIVTEDSTVLYEAKEENQ